MNSQNSGIPDELRAAWKETRVRTPEALDRSVLQRAADAAKPGRGKQLAGWLQPLAYAATLLLGVALVYEMQTAVPPEIPVREAAPGAGPDENEAAATRTPAFQEPAIRSLLNDRRIHELKAAPSPGANSRETATTTGRTEKSSVTGRELAEDSCRPAETASADDWWKCIGTLREAGLDTSAAAELERLRARYPDFTPPR